MKKQLSFIFVFIMLISLLPGCGPSGLEKDDSGAYCITSTADLAVMAEHPDKDYILTQDIDFAGAEWAGIVAFSGSFNGNSHSISNVKLIPPSESTDLGFFASVAAEGQIKDLHLVNVTADASSTSANSIGALAGTNNGKITGCTATGLITDTRTDASGGSIAVGALVGTAAAGSVLEGGASLSVTDANDVWTTDGLCADVKLFVADCDTVTRGLVGNTASGATVSGLWRDQFYSSERNSDLLKERQAIVVDYMRTMGEVEWTVDQPVKFSAEPATSVHNQEFVPGTVYTGLPYVHPCGGIERFLYCFDENTVLADWVFEEMDVPGTTTSGLGLSAYMGNDCSGAVDLAWLRVSSTNVYRGGCVPQTTDALLPSKGAQKQFGIFPVGQMEGDTFDAEDAAYSTDSIGDSTDIVSLNGEATILEAYAMARAADAVLYRTSAGHVRLLAIDPIVIRNGDNTIDPLLSYMVTIEQGDGLYNRREGLQNSSWRVDYRYTFDVLLHGSSLEDKVARQLEAGSGKCYVPITIRALREETVYEPTITIARPVSAPESGNLISDWRFLSLRTVFKDLSGKEVLDRTCFTRGRETLNNIEVGLVNDGLTSFLAPGQYTFTMTATMTDGTEFVVAENVAYEKK